MALSAQEWCGHCDAEPRHYSNGLCQPCEKYRRKYDRLPGGDLLVKRQRRKDEKRDMAKIENRPGPNEGSIERSLEEIRQQAPTLHPINGILLACDKAGRNVAALEYLISQRTTYLGHNRFNEEVIHPLTALYGEWLDRYGRLQKMALDANVDQQRLNLAEGNARAIFSVVKEALSGAGLNPAQEAAINESLARGFRQLSA